MRAIATNRGFGKWQRFRNRTIVRTKRWVSASLLPILQLTAIKLSRHVGMDCRHPDYMDVFNACHPWPWIPPVLGGMTRVCFNLTAVILQLAIVSTVDGSVTKFSVKIFRRCGSGRCCRFGRVRIGLCGKRNGQHRWA